MINFNNEVFMITLDKVKALGRGEIKVITCKSEALKAVRSNGYSLMFVKDQTPEICLEAVRNSGGSLQYVKDQTPEICLEAVRNSGGSLQYVDITVFPKAPKEHTMEELTKILGYDVKIIK